MEKIYEYTVHLEPADEGGYTVTVRALPSVVTEGDTYKEALAMAQDAIECYLESLVKDGWPIPIEQHACQPVDTRIQVKAPATL